MILFEILAKIIKIVLSAGPASIRKRKDAIAFLVIIAALPLLGLAFEGWGGFVAVLIGLIAFVLAVLLLVCVMAAPIVIYCWIWGKDETVEEGPEPADQELEKNQNSEPEEIDEYVDVLTRDIFEKGRSDPNPWSRIGATTGAFIVTVCVVIIAIIIAVGLALLTEVVWVKALAVGVTLIVWSVGIVRWSYRLVKRLWKRVREGPNPTKYDFREFWETTWAVWRSGALSPISENYAKIARVPFEKFFRTSGDANSPLIAEFLAMHPPRQQEFAIGFNDLGEQTTLFLTNQRLWMYDKGLRDYVTLELDEVAAFRSSGGEPTYKVSVYFKNHSQRNYDQILCCPKDKAIEFAIARCNDPNGWHQSYAPATNAPSKAKLL